MGTVPLGGELMGTVPLGGGIFELKEVINRLHL